MRREAVIAALRHSADTGWPASGDAVGLLVSYALSEITAREYAERILPQLSTYVAVPDGVPGPSSSVADPVEPLRETPPPAGSDPVTVGSITREDAVQAYVTGRIPVGEFLRIARG